MAVCPKCGRNVPDGSKFCSYCGAKLGAPAQTPQQNPWGGNAGAYGNFVPTSAPNNSSNVGSFVPTSAPSNSSNFDADRNFGKTVLLDSGTDYGAPGNAWNNAPAAPSEPPRNSSRVGNFVPTSAPATATDFRDYAGFGSAGSTPPSNDAPWNSSKVGNFVPTSAPSNSSNFDADQNFGKTVLLDMPADFGNPGSTPANSAGSAAPSNNAPWNSSRVGNFVPTSVPSNSSSFDADQNFGKTVLLDTPVDFGNPGSMPANNAGSVASGNNAPWNSSKVGNFVPTSAPSNSSNFDADQNFGKTVLLDTPVDFGNTGNTPANNAGSAAPGNGSPWNSSKVGNFTPTSAPINSSNFDADQNFGKTVLLDTPADFGNTGSAPVNNAGSAAPSNDAPWNSSKVGNFTPTSAPINSSSFDADQNFGKTVLLDTPPDYGKAASTPPSNGGNAWNNSSAASGNGGWGNGFAPGNSAPAGQAAPAKPQSAPKQPKAAGKGSKKVIIGVVIAIAVVLIAVIAVFGIRALLAGSDDEEAAVYIPVGTYAPAANCSTDQSMEFASAGMDEMMRV